MKSLLFMKHKESSSQAHSRMNAMNTIVTSTMYVMMQCCSLALVFMVVTGRNGDMQYSDAFVVTPSTSSLVKEGVFISQQRPGQKSFFGGKQMYKRKMYQQQRRQLRVRMQNNSNNSSSNNSSSNNSSSNYDKKGRRMSKRNRRFDRSGSQERQDRRQSQPPENRKSLFEYDITKPSAFTIHCIAPALEQVSSTQLSSAASSSSSSSSSIKQQKIKQSGQRRKGLPKIVHKPVVSPSVNQKNQDPCGPFTLGELPITYTNDPTTVNKWLCDNISYQDGNSFTCLGFDVESAPDLPWRKPTSTASSLTMPRPSTVQLSTPHSSLIIHLTPDYDTDESLLQPLQNVLSDPTIIKAGAGIDDDMLELYRWKSSLHAKCRFDIGGIGSSANGNRIGLQRLVRAIVGAELLKSKRIAMSDWSQVPLTMKQIHYASRDAWAGAAVVAHLGCMNHETMNVELIGNTVVDMERDMVDLNKRAMKRKKAKKKFKEMLKQKKEQYMYSQSNRGNDAIDRYQSDISLDVTGEEMDLLQRIINDTAPDGLLYFPQEKFGLDFSF